MNSLNYISLTESLSKLFYLNVSYIWCSELNIFINANNKLITSALNTFSFLALNPPQLPLPWKQVLVHSNSVIFSSCESLCQNTWDSSYTLSNLYAHVSHLFYLLYFLKQNRCLKLEWFSWLMKQYSLCYVWEK